MVVEFEDQYVDNLIFAGTTMILLAIVACIGAPLIIYHQYNRIYVFMKLTENSQFLVWAIVTVFIFTDHLLTWIPLFYNYIGWVRKEWNTQYQPVYWLTIIFWSLVAAVDIPVIAVIVRIRNKRNFPVPRLIRVLSRCCPVQWRNFFMQFVAIFHTVLAIQIFCFYSAMVFVAFIARPIHTVVLFAFFGVFIFFLVTSLMLLFARTEDINIIKSKCSRTLLTILAVLTYILFVFFICFYAFTFLRLTIFVGDTNLPNLRLPVYLLPTAIITILGVLAKVHLGEKESPFNYTFTSRKEDGQHREYMCTATTEWEDEEGELSTKQAGSKYFLTHMEAKKQATEKLQRKLMADMEEPIDTLEHCPTENEVAIAMNELADMEETTA